jgi:mannitol/fructose-specific phosphotransferase system IIA component (Ntr-type)
MGGQRGKNISAAQVRRGRNFAPFHATEKPGRDLFLPARLLACRRVSVPTDFIAEPDCIVLNLPARTGDDAVRALHRQLCMVTDAVVDPPRFLAALLDRMHLAPVCIAPDVALPHARTDAVRRITLAVGRAEEGIDFGAGHERVRLVFLIGTPREAATEYLQTAAKLARLLRVPALRDNLLAARDEAAFRSAMSGGVAAPR